MWRKKREQREVTSNSDADQAEGASGSTSAMRDALKCGICLDLLDEQFRVLECGHSYCLHCLQSCLASSSEQRSLPCPKCKQVTTIPSGRVSSLKVNYDLKAIRDAIVIESKKTERGKKNAAGSDYNSLGASQTDKERAQLNLNVATARYQKYLDGNKDTTRRINEVANRLESEINAHFKDLVTVLEENKLKLLNDVKEIRQSRVSEMETDRVKAERTMKKFKECQERLKKVNKMKPTSDKYKTQLKSVCNESEAMVNSRPPDINKSLLWMQYIPETETGSIQCGRLKTDRRINLEFEVEFGRGWFHKLGKAQGLAVTPQGLIAVAETTANRVSVWENVKGIYERKFCLKTPWHTRSLNKPTDVAVTPQGTFVVVDGSNTIKIFSASGEYDENEWVKEEGTTCITCDPRPDPSNFILMDSGRNIARFDISSHIFSPIFAETPFYGIATNGNMVAVSNFKDVRIFDVNSGMKLLSFEARVRGLCFDDKTESILVSTCDRQVGQYCIKTGQLLGMVSTDCLNDPLGLGIIPGRRLAVADDQTVKVYRIIDS